MYHGVKTGIAPFRRGPMAGLFGCDVDREDFDAENTVRVYPGRPNVWLFVRRRGKGPTIKSIIEDFITDPLDTSWTSNNVAVGEPVKLANDPEKVRLSMISWGLRPQEKTLSKLTYPVDLGDDLEFWQVVFHPPADSKTVVPWPLVGCAEDADWALSGALSDIDISTGQKSPTTNSGNADRPASSADLERQRQISLEQLQAGREYGDPNGEGSSLTTWLVLGVGAVGAVWYARRKGLIQL